MRYGDSEPIPRFGALVRAYRHEAGLTQQELAAKAGLSAAAVRDFEQSRRCRPWPSSLSALANALDLDADHAARLARAAALGTAGVPGSDQRLWLVALGPLEVYRGGMPLTLGSSTRRAVLGLLLMDPGAPVRRDAIVDVLWGEKPPRTAVGLVQAHMSRLRKVLRPQHRSADGEGVIESVSGAYRLNLSAQEVDLLAFRDLAARAAAVRADGDHITACGLYDRAVGLWRGDPLADVELPDGLPGLARLRQQLADVLLRYADVAFALGEHRKVLPRLQALTAAEPLNGQAHARLMIALAGCGQQAAAIRVYQNLQSRLDWEPGLYPDDELAAAGLRVLCQDTAAVVQERERSYRPAPVDSPQVKPRQLPAAPPHFSARTDELDALSCLLGQDTGVAIAALTGMAGIGKTALAVHWAHRVADRFPDGQLFVDLCGFSLAGAPLASGEAVRYFLTALGVSPARIPADPAGRAGLYRSLLVGRRMLIVLDNARDAEQIRPLLPGSAGCLVLVTSRNRLTGLAAAEGAHLFTLGELTDEESRALLTRNLGAERVMADPVAVNALIALCGRLPMALRSVAARAAARPALSLAVFAAGMLDERVRLDVLETGESATSVRMVFCLSSVELSEPAGRMFRMLGAHAGPDITVAAAASLAGMPRNEAYLALAELCDGHMVIERATGRYICHELLRVYAAEELRARDGEAGRRAAVRRVLDHYLRTADAASAALCPAYTRLPWDRPLSGVLPEDVGDPQQAARWFESERQVLLAVIGWAVVERHVPHIWELPWAAGMLFSGEVHWRIIADTQEAALALADELGDLAGQALARHHLSLLRFWLGDSGTVCHHLSDAIELRNSVAGNFACGRALPAPDL